MVSILRRFALAMAFFALTAAPAAPQPAFSVDVPFEPDPVLELLALLNDVRREAGIAALAVEPALTQAAAHRAAEAAATGEFDGTADTVMELSTELRRAGYPPYAWRQRLVQGPRDAAALVRQWRAAEPDGFAEVALGDFEGFGAAQAPGTDPPIWSLFVALPRITWERRQAAPLDDLGSVRAAVLAEINRLRAEKGLSPLTPDERLAGAAQAHATDMLARRFYDHVTPEGHTLAQRVADSGYTYRRAAENIAKGVFEPAEVVRRWMLSSGHRRNILDPHSVHIGIGVVRGEEQGQVTALWVLDFAAPV